jgi:hypothetical protein
LPRFFTDMTVVAEAFVTVPSMFRSVRQYTGFGAVVQMQNIDL